MSDYTKFWVDAKEKVSLFSKLDDANLVFGAKTSRSGHEYKIAPVMTVSEILAIEKKKKISLPEEFRTYLTHFGAGGAGPYYGVKDFRKTFENTSFDRPFVYTEISNQTNDVADNEPIKDFSGLIYVCTAGCCTDFYLELLGEHVGMVWCNWGDGGCNSEGNFFQFYTKWLNKVEKNLTRYHKIKEISKRFHTPSLACVAEHMGCEYREYREYQPYGKDDNALQGLTCVCFDETPVKIFINDKKNVVYFDFSNMTSI